MLTVNKNKAFTKASLLTFCLFAMLTVNLFAGSGTIYIGADFNASNCDINFRYSYQINETISVDLSPKLTLAGTDNHHKAESPSFAVTTSLGLQDLVALDLTMNAKQLGSTKFEYQINTTGGESLSGNDNGTALHETDDRSRQATNRYLYDGSDQIIEFDKDKNQDIVSFIISALKVFYVGKATCDGYKQDKLWGAIRNCTISRVVIALSDGATDKLKSKSSILSSTASKGIFSAGNAVMYGTDFSLNFGTGSLNLSQGDWKWADFQGNTLSDIQTVMGYMTIAEDFGKLRLFRDVTAKEMQQRQIKEGGPRLGEPDLRKVNIDKIELVTSRYGDEPYRNKFADNDGNLVPGEGEHINEYRFGGRLHVDRRQTGWVWHTDELGSWRTIKDAPWVDPRSNPLTGLQHILYEANPLGKHTGILLYKVYRNHQIEQISYLL